jgi:hypothetical protein
MFHIFYSLSRVPKVTFTYSLVLGSVSYAILWDGNSKEPPHDGSNYVLETKAYPKFFNLMSSIPFMHVSIFFLNSKSSIWFQEH